MKLLSIASIHQILGSHLTTTTSQSHGHLTKHLGVIFQASQLRLRQSLGISAARGQGNINDAQVVGLQAKQTADTSWPSTDSPSLSATGTHSSKSSGSAPQQMGHSTWTCHRKGYSSQTPGGLATSVSALSERAQTIHSEVNKMITEYVYPVERKLFAHQKSADRWKIHPIVEQLKDMAKSKGLWNLFLTSDTDPRAEYGAGLTFMEYAHISELLGKSSFASEIFNCSGPDNGNMELLIKYGTEKQKEQWLKPLLAGTIRSCFAATEQRGTSVDPANVQSSINRDGDDFIISGRKWWITGSMDPRCKICIFMGKTDPTADTHRQQSMVLIPMDTPGITIIRPLSIFGYEDPPTGHGELLFENVRVPAENLILGEGRAFEIERDRFGPGWVRHGMRFVGMAERCMELMVDRVQNRVAFGKPLAEQGTIQEAIAESRIEIEQARLLTLKAAHLMDTVGNKAARPEIAMVQVVAPTMAQRVVERAMQAFGGAGLSADWPLAYFYSRTCILKLAATMNMGKIARMELRKSAKDG